MVTITADVPPEFVSEEICAARLRISVFTLRKLRRKKIIRGVKVGQALRFWWPSVVESLLAHEESQ